MFIATAVVSGLLAVTLLASARIKLVKDEAGIAVMTKIGVPVDKLWLLAVAEIAGAAGLVAGLFWWPIGVAAAIGVILYFLGAIAFHLRAHDNHLAPPTVLLLVSIAALALRATTTG